MNGPDTCPRYLPPIPAKVWFFAMKGNTLGPWSDLTLNWSDDLKNRLTDKKECVNKKYRTF